MHNSLAGRVMLVLGGGGVASAVARRLLARGATVHVVARKVAPLHDLEANNAMVHRVADASTDGTIEACVATTVAISGRVDGIVNCIGSLLLKPAHSTTDDELRELFAVNVSTAFAAVRGAARHMRENGGSIVLVSSVAAATGFANHEGIAAAKAAIEGLTRSAAATYAGSQIRVNCIAPGLLRTKLTERFTKSEAALKASTAMHPLGRIGEAEDAASAIEWFLDPATNWVTGQVLGVDGGLSAVRR
jgi:3-oxoacyl-[acyl-carrier protein] reductase